MRYAWPLLLLALCACEKPLPNPEMVDPIYLDLVSRKSAAEADAVSLKADLEKAHEDVVKSKPQTGDSRRAQKTVETLAIKARKAEQERQYLELLVKRRLKYSREEYMKAYSEKKPWPNSEEFHDYQTNRRLRTVSRKWDDHLPKLPSRLPADEQVQPKKEAPKSEGGGEGGGH